MTIFTHEEGFATCAPVALAIGPEDLLRRDPASASRLRVDAATIEGELLVVTGYVAPNIWIEVSLPRDAWTQRLLVIAPGGYGGSISREPWPSSPLTSLDGAEREMVIATYDTGHRGSTSFPADGLWAVDDPQAVVDFAYESVHRVAVAVKALVLAAYGHPARYSYLMGMSSGGRISMASSQRYPDDFDGIASDCPTIDMVSTNTYWHAWNAKVNTGSDGRPILTADRLAGLHSAVLREAERQGARIGNAVLDPRLVAFDPARLAGSAVPSAERLTDQQAAVVAALYAGPATAEGERLFPLGLPLGSELAWEGLMVPASVDPHAALSIWNSSEMMYSHEFPDFMASFTGPTGLRGPAFEYTEEEFDRLHELSCLYDPTNPDLRAFRERGGRLLIWQGWADPASSPYSVLNYLAAVRRELGDAALDDTVALYMVPGMYHGGMGPDSSFGDYLSPLMRWVETAREPRAIDIVFDHLADASDPWPLDRYVAAPAGTTDVTPWRGSSHYAPSHQKWGVVRPVLAHDRPSRSSD